MNPALVKPRYIAPPRPSIPCNIWFLGTGHDKHSNFDGYLIQELGGKFTLLIKDGNDDWRCFRRLVTKKSGAKDLSHPLWALFFHRAMHRKLFDVLLFQLPVNSAGCNQNTSSSAAKFPRIFSR